MVENVKANIKTKNLVPIVISCIALLVSFMTVYYSHLLPARIKIVAGEILNIGHFPEGNLSINIPINIVNNGAKTATVKRVALIIQTPESPEGYLLEPFCYQRLNEKQNFVFVSMAVPITVASRQSITKSVLFRSSLERPNEFHIIKTGTYALKLIGWTKDHLKPEVFYSFSLIISNDIAKKLQQSLIDKKYITYQVRQSLWEKWAASFLTEDEIEELN